jgi:DNA-binding transcriptional regulator PaaX
VRTLLIPRIPAHRADRPGLCPIPLLPPDWPGRAAFDLTKALYAKVAERSTRFARTLENEAGALPEPRAAFHRRFGRSARR